MNWSRTDTKQEIAIELGIKGVKHFATLLYGACVRTAHAVIVPTCHQTV